jgi:hypothetical protein
MHEFHAPGAGGHPFNPIGCEYDRQHELQQRAAEAAMQARRAAPQKVPTRPSRPVRPSVPAQRTGPVSKAVPVSSPQMGSPVQSSPNTAPRSERLTFSISKWLGMCVILLVIYPAWIFMGLLVQEGLLGNSDDGAAVQTGLIMIPLVCAVLELLRRS